MVLHYCVGPGGGVECLHVLPESVLRSASDHGCLGDDNESSSFHDFRRSHLLILGLITSSCLGWVPCGWTLTRGQAPD